MRFKESTACPLFFLISMALGWILVTFSSFEGILN